MKNYIPLRKYKHPFKETARRDPYRSTLKPKGQPICPSCRAVSIRGRWLSRRQLEHQKTPVEPTQEVKCPACRQKEDQFALGVIEIRGEAWRQNQEEILNTLKNTESIARSRNDQERILWVKELKTMVKVYVSLPELARQMGRELENSFQGFTEYSHSTEEPYLRVRWWSDLPRMKHRPGHALELGVENGANTQQKQRVQKSRAFRARSRG